jgi:outer membrane protein OmpA-like peptidoglycan-associated protein
VIFFSAVRAFWLLGLGGLVACASSSTALPLRHVVLYRSGMGYFEHAGSLRGSHLKLRLRQGEVDDVMKTIAVMSKDDGAVVGAVAALKPRGDNGDVELDLSVASDREITLSYAVPTPTWRSTHKLVLGDGDTGVLQTWAIIDNATDEDWRDVRLTLATGAPLSFAVDLHTAQFVARPDASGHLVQPSAVGVVKAERGRPGDQDGDGIPDDRDACPQQAEDKDGFEDDDGCPDPDNDKDRILDVDDKCPNEPETYNGFEDDDGCPDKGRVIVRRGKLEILDSIYFGHGKPVILPISSPLLDAIAATLNGNPQILSLEVAGHAAANETDPGGLASARAAAVHDALVARNVAGARLVKRGYATTRPACTQASEACWSKNRRVDFRILRRADDEPSAETRAREAPATPVKPTLAALENALRAAPTTTEEVAGMLRYDIQTPVTIPARASAMVAIQNRRLAGTEVYLYRPDPAAPGTERHPFRAARFECPTGQEMEAGPLAIYARGTYVGDAILDRLHAGEISFVPFAIDGATTVTVSSEDSAVPHRLVKIEHGVLTVEDRKIHRTTYEIAASDAAPARIVVRHDLKPGYRVTQLPTGSIDTEQGHLVPFTLRSAAKTALVLDEEQPARREVRPLEGQTADIEAYLRGSPKVPAPIASQLRRAGAIETGLNRLAVDVHQVHDRLDDSSRRMNELRENLVSIEKNASADKLRRELTQRLTQATRAHEELEKKLAQLTADDDEKHAQIRTLLQDLDLAEMAP